MVNYPQLAMLMSIGIGMIFCLILTLSLSIIISSSPTSKIVQHDMSLLNNATSIIGESASLDESINSLNNAVQNLSLFNAFAIIAMTVSGGISVIVFLMQRKNLNKLKLTLRLTESSTITIALLFGLMVLFYTSADLTNLSQEQTITQILSSIMSTDKNHDQQIQLLSNFIIDKITQYRIDVENSIFFGLLTFIAVINLIVHKFKSDSVVPFIVFFAIVGSVLLWAEGYLVSPEHIQPFAPCMKVHC